MRERAIILNVDDDEAGRFAATHVLRTSGFEVWEASTGAEALRLTEKQPDLVLLDVGLPDMNGYEVCRRIKGRRETAHIIVVHLSASLVADVDKVHGLEQGADGYLTEPISQQELIATVRSFLRIREAEVAQRFLAGASALLSSSLAVEDSLRRMARQAAAFMGEWCLVHRLREPGESELVALAQAGLPPDAEPIEFELRFPRQHELERTVARVMASRRAEIYPVPASMELAAAEHPGQGREFLREIGAQSYLCAPLLARGQTLGALTFIRAELNRRFRAEDLAVACDLAERVGFCIDNARLLENERRSHQQIFELQQLTAALADARTVQQVADVAVERALHCVDASSGVVCVVDRSGQARPVAAQPAGVPGRSNGIPLDDSVPLAAALRSGEPVWIEDRPTLLRDYPALGEAEAPEAPLQSAVALPLRFETRVCGGLGLSFARPRSFSDEERAFLMSFADQCAQALERAQLVESERAAQQALQKSEAQFRAMFELAAVGMAQTDPSSGAFSSVNQRFCQISGYSAEELSKLSLFDLTHADDRAADSALFEAMLRGDAPSYEATKRFVRKDGRVVWVDVNATALRDAAGRARRVVAIAQDVTARQAAESDLRERADFERQLIGIVSHDLRNPLAVIALAAATLLAREDLDERTLRTALRIRGSVDRASRLIRDLLDFTQARLGGGIPVDRKACNLHQITQQAVEELRETFAECSIEFEHAGDGAATLDPDRVAQVVSNLVSNAVRHGRAGAPVRVVSRADHRGLTLQVTNFGEPIAPSTRARLFEPLYRGEPTIDKTSRSVGLGLYIVHHVVRAHGGSIAVESTPEAGTTFTVHLPV